MVSGGSKMEFDNLKGTEVKDFFRILKVYQDNLKTKQASKTNG